VNPATQEEDEEWKAVKAAYGKEGIPVIADESISTVHDVITMKVCFMIYLFICLLFDYLIIIYLFAYYLLI
jgi:hypothetical protein